MELSNPPAPFSGREEGKGENRGFWVFLTWNGVIVQKATNTLILLISKMFLNEITGKGDLG